MSCLSIAACGGNKNRSNLDEFSDIGLSDDDLLESDSPYLVLLSKFVVKPFFGVPNDSPAVRSAAFGCADDANTAFRSEMQDVTVVEPSFGPDGSRSLVAVFDGHGGADGSKLASDFVVQAVGNEIGRRDPREIFEDAFTASDMVFEGDSVMFQGTTALVVVLERLGDVKLLHLANVGDSRALLASTTSDPMIIHPLHTPDNAVEVERITTSGGFVARGKVNGMVSVTRSLGNLPMKEIVLSDPFVTTITLTGTETWLVLACDGVYDVMSPESVVAACSRAASAQQAAEAVVKEAIDLGSTDNVSVITVKLNAEV